MSDVSMVVNYGERAELRVEFRLSRVNPAVVMGRYLEGVDGVGATGPWEVRVPDESEPDHVRILEAIREVLTQYAGGELEPAAAV